MHAALRKNIKYGLWQSVSEIIKSALPSAWLNGEAIELAISSLLVERKLENSVLMCPTYIYLSVFVKSYDLYFVFLMRNEALNKELILFPLNVSIDSGSHWVLTLINFRMKSIILMDSNNTAPARKILLKVLFLTGACYVAANLVFNPSEWKLVICSDTVL